MSDGLSWPVGATTYMATGAELPASTLSRAKHIRITVLRVYRIIAVGLVRVRVIQLTILGQD
ncbi:hypothetical protein [Hyphomicrobium sp. ghe19]|uniref:hypothetical protein n=1 Tax=Hyphomicrobium sp. ghe19 TaxID=2682968 RepID=UPI001366FB62|nr:hypothetical protein HYPP_04045 [Hyphomicrobium sp. ghe19]